MSERRVVKTKRLSASAKHTKPKPASPTATRPAASLRTQATITIVMMITSPAG